jgi:hypothetical protein
VTILGEPLCHVKRYDSEACYILLQRAGKISLRKCGSPLTLVEALRYPWLISIGTRTIRDGLRCLVDRTVRRDLSIF